MWKAIIYLTSESIFLRCFTWCWRLKFILHPEQLDLEQPFMIIPLVPGGGGVLLGIPGEGVQPGSLNPDPISDQKISFSRPVFRPDL